MIASLLEQVRAVPQSAPRRLLLYGIHGIGKSTFAAGAPKPVVIQAEDGLGSIEVPRFPLAKEFGHVLAALVELYRGSHEYETVVVDSVDWLERMIWREVCRDHSKDSIEEIPYAKGYAFAVDYWRRVLEGLDALRRERGMGVVLVAHSRIEKFEDPEHSTYSRYAPALHRHASALVQEWVDEVLFATYRVHVRQADEGFGRKRGQGIGSGERVLRTEERPSHLAKNRLGLPFEMPLAWSAYAAHFPKNDIQSEEKTNG